MWEKAKPYAKIRYITNAQFRLLLKEIEAKEEYNTLYYQTLIKCIYEGVYCDDLSVITNLRGSEINNNRIILRKDQGETFDIRVSDDLIREMKELSAIDVWYRNNRYGKMGIEMIGIHNDSVFKFEKRSNRRSKVSTTTETHNRYHVYYKKIKNALKYLDYTISPEQLYISGIMYRICTLLKDNNYSVKDAFSNNRSYEMREIIVNEIERSNYISDLEHFYALVKDYVEIFTNDDLESLDYDIFTEIIEEVSAYDYEEGFDEGREYLKQHLTHERNSRLVFLAKEKFKERNNGKLYCEVCGFDFNEKYGSYGMGFIEAHHKLPVAEMQEGDVTKIEDLVMLCSNCHSMVHYKREWLTIDELKQIIENS